jgi:ribosomal protein S27AE
LDGLIVFVAVVFILAVIAALFTAWRTFDQTWGRHADKPSCPWCGGETRFLAWGFPGGRWECGSCGWISGISGLHKTRKVMMTSDDARKYRGKAVPPSFFIDVEEDHPAF